MSPDPEPPEPPALPVTAAVVLDHPAAHGPFHTHCENCATKLAGPFCSQCGQHDFEFHRSFWHVFLEGLESFLHFDSKLFRTVVTLLIRPGRLTADFNAGKRASQMPPLRLYIFVSLVFFFLLFLDQKAPARLFQSDLAPAAGKTGTPASAPDLIPREQQAKSPYLQWVNTQAQRAAEPQHQRELIDRFMHALPKMLLFCLPLFALYTRVLFRKAGLVYLQHLVLALHFHTLIFLWAMLKDGWLFLAGFVGPDAAGFLEAVFNVWLLLYPFLMFRHLFAGSWLKTIVKTGLFGVAYSFTLVFAALVGGFILFAML